MHDPWSHRRKSTGYISGTVRSNISAGFVSSLVSAGAFDAMLSSMVSVPLQTGSVGSISVGATAYSVAEGSAKAISRLSITGQQMTPQKAHCVVVVTEELARSPLVAASQLIGNALRAALAQTTDAQFISIITSGLSTATSTGATAEAVLTDIAGLLDLRGKAANYLSSQQVWLRKCGQRLA